MLRSLFLGLFAIFSVAIYANNKIRIKAEEHFSRGEWKEASEIYNILISSEKNNLSLYAPSIIAAGKCNNYNRVIEYIVFSENCGIPLDSVFNRTLTLSLKVRSADVYENMLLTVSKKQPWLKNFINGHLLQFYCNRKNNEKVIEIADVIINSKPKNITDIMLVKAKALNDMGDTGYAIAIMDEIINIDNNNIDARLFLGYYYFNSAKQSIKNGNFIVRLPGKRGKKSTKGLYVNTDIYTALKRAKNFLDVEILTDKRPYVQNSIKEIETMIAAFEN
jgi:tetratricopeptide (TPR) repeat protein